MSAGLSDGFVYAPKPPAAPAANIRVSVPPHNKDTFKSGDVVMFNIPCGKRGQYLKKSASSNFHYILLCAFNCFARVAVPELTKRFSFNAVPGCRT